MQDREKQEDTSTLTDDKIFACVDCSYKTNNKSKLSHHMISHFEKKLFKCSELDCIYETNVKSDLKIHSLNHSGVKLFQCSQCDYKTNKKHSMVSHSLIHCTEKNLKCTICDYETNRKSCLESHTRNHAEEKLFNCSECKYGTNRKADLKKHLLIHKKSVKLFKCSECNFEVFSKILYNNHMRTHTNADSYTDSENQFDVDMKKRSQLIITNIKSLRLQHDKEIKQYRCSQCGYETRRKSNLNVHLLTHSKSFLCPDCDVGNDFAGISEVHLLSKTENDSLICFECSYETSQKKNLKSHLFTHGKASLQTCDGCSRDFFVKRNETQSDEMMDTKNSNTSLNSDNIMEETLKEMEILNEKPDIQEALSVCKDLDIKESKLFAGEKGCLKDEILSVRKLHVSESETLSDEVLLPLKTTEIFITKITSEEEPKTNSNKQFISDENELISKYFKSEKVDKAFSKREYETLSRDFILRKPESSLKRESIGTEMEMDTSLFKDKSSVMEMETETSSSREIIFSETEASLDKESFVMEMETKTSSTRETNLSETETFSDKGSTVMEMKSSLKSPLTKDIEANEEERRKKADNDPLKLQVFQCSKCEYRTKRLVNLKRHLQTHTREIEKLKSDADTNIKKYKSLLTFNKNKKLYSCSKCSYRTHKRSKLNSHFAIHLEKKLFKCAREGCKYETNVKSDLRIHELNHSGIRLFKCLECDYETNKKHSLKSHSLIHLREKTLKCSLCDYVTNRRSCLENHKRNHSDTRLFNCSECSYGTNRKSDLKKHYLTHNTEEFYKCSECDFKVVDKRLFNSHLLIHSNTKSYSCTLCSFQTDSKRNLKAHTLNHSNIKVLQCSVCSYSTNYTSNFKLHLQSHEAIKLHKCPHCSYGTHRKANLNIHILTHTKPFQCPGCDILFALTSTSEVHMLKKTDNGSFICLICSYETNRRGNLRSHLLTHVNTRLQKCFGCKREFFVKEIVPPSDRGLSVNEPVPADRELSVNELVAAERELCVSEPEDISGSESCIRDSCIEESEEILSEKDSRITEYEALLREGFHEVNYEDPSNKKNFDSKNDVDSDFFLRKFATPSNKNYNINKSKTSVDDDCNVAEIYSSSDRESTARETCTSEEACIRESEASYKDFLRKSVWSNEDDCEGN